MNPLAVHEAGHTLVALEMGDEVISTTIVPSNGGGGWTHIEAGRGEEVETLAVLVAGELAERHLFGGREGFDWRADHGDAERARYVLRICGRDLDGLRRAKIMAEMKATNILLLRWDDLLALAHELERRQTLSGEQIQAVLRSSEAQPIALKAVQSKRR